jgi:hypothetical protein
MNLADENEVIALILRYGFDLSGQSAAVVVRSWSCKYDPSFLVLAVIESLHLGRYKIVSVEQILNGWQRRGQATPHFGAEFAKMVGGQEQSSVIEEDAQTTLLLDQEIALFSDSDLADMHHATEVFELSDPALDEGIGIPESKPQQSLLSIIQKHQVSLDLTPTSYPPTAPRPPRNNWEQQATPLDELFIPAAQVSQFYYKLRAMAASAPIREAEEPPQAAEG